MKKNLSRSIAALALVASAGLANAAETMVLNDAQMDAVSAGAQHSVATGSASVLYGMASTSAQTSAYSNGPVRITTASALGVAIGFGAAATTSANSSF